MSLTVRNVVYRAKAKERPNILFIPFNGLLEESLAAKLPFNFYMIRKLSLIGFGGLKIAGVKDINLSNIENSNVDFDLIVDSSMESNAASQISERFHCPVLQLSHIDGLSGDNLITASKDLGGPLSYFFLPNKPAEKTKVMIRFISEQYNVPNQQLLQFLRNKGYDVSIYTENNPLPINAKLFIDLAADNILPYYSLALLNSGVPTVCLDRPVRQKTLHEGCVLCPDINELMVRVESILSRQTVYNELSESCLNLAKNYTDNNIEDWTTLFSNNCKRMFQR
jgi:hypothetical protein